MTITERLFALKKIPGFASLRDNELVAVAYNVSERAYLPGKVIISPGTRPSHLYVVVEGNVRDSRDGRRLSPIVGAELLLSDRPAPSALTSDPSRGAVCLLLSKGHFFTMVHECPVVLAEWMRLGVAGMGGS